MATNSIDQNAATPAGGDPSATLALTLATRFAVSLLPAEKADFDSERLAEAARFAMIAAHRRRGSEPSMAIESVGGSETSARYLRIAVVNDDMPFLVDSITATIAEQGLSIDRLAHPVVAVRRDADGHLVDLPEGEAPGEIRESIVYLETERADAKARRELTNALAATLGDVHAAVADWPRMQAAMQEDARRLADPEGAALLRWLADGMLTQLGHVTRRRDGHEENQLGICRASDQPLLAPSSYERAFAWFDHVGESGAGRAPLIVKANRIARVHRRVPLDLFIVPVIEQGQVVALSVHAGVWTSAALAAAWSSSRASIWAMVARATAKSRASCGWAMAWASSGRCAVRAQ